MGRCHFIVKPASCDTLGCAPNPVQLPFYTTEPFAAEGPWCFHLIGVCSEGGAWRFRFVPIKWCSQAYQLYSKGDIIPRCRLSFPDSMTPSLVCLPAGVESTCSSRNWRLSDAARGSLAC